MVRVLMCGCYGQMGRTITQMVEKEEEMEIVAGVDLITEGPATYPVFPSVEECDVPVDVIIDFSSSKTTDSLLEYCVKTNTPVVLCSTGLSEEQLQKVQDASTKVAVLKSANMSLGINLLMKLLKEATAVLGEAGFDIEIVEKHHNRKLDAPSGTALALADSVNEAAGNKYHYVYDRSQRRERRDVSEIGISAVRGGSIVGDHDVIFAGQDEVITFSHTAYSRALFAKGAVSAAKFLAGKEAGFYTMQDVIG
ncbi:MAG: 4-hydroxy-tetrahydrodipicolinate reductase [Lachnospiraceae bacterium]|nr:4-hydroxy-tetrahydrodipicolinate reductase [Lachnospiraceae bacterium]